MLQLPDCFLSHEGSFCLTSFLPHTQDKLKNVIVELRVYWSLLVNSYWYRFHHGVDGRFMSKRLVFFHCTRMSQQHNLLRKIRWRYKKSYVLAEVPLLRFLDFGTERPFQKIQNVTVAERPHIELITRTDSVMTP